MKLLTTETPVFAPYNLRIDFIQYTKYPAVKNVKTIDKSSGVAFFLVLQRRKAETRIVKSVIDVAIVRKNRRARNGSVRVIVCNVTMYGKFMKESINKAMLNTAQIGRPAK
jgi:hypothetical protein